MQKTTIGFIGAGNMARSLINGLINNQYDANQIWVSNRSADKLPAFKDQLGIQTTQDNIELVKQCQVLVLAVKPQQLKALCQQIKPHIAEQLIVSIAAGVTDALLQKWLGKKLAIVRAMPNTPSLVGAGATGLYANTDVSPSQKDLAESILRSVGLTVWLNDESQIPLVCALSGSGPAYFFLIMEALQTGISKMGLPDETARLLTMQLALGSARLAMESPQDFAQLRKAVTSPGGTTEQAIKVLEAGELQKLMANAMDAAYRRSLELTELLDEN